MNDTVKSEKYRKLSITALVTGILIVSLVGFQNFLWIPIANFLHFSQISNALLLDIVMFSSMSIVAGLSITAVVCGSIDLKRIRAGLYSKKGKGFDIAGIVLGGAIVLFALFFVLLGD